MPANTNQGPRLIAWEVTRACNLSCRHCRAEAITEALPDQLSLAEAVDLVGEFKKTGNPIIILTGGEPLLRPDIFELIAEIKRHGLKCVMAPNGTLINAGLAQKIQKSGVERCSISLDASTAKAHDSFRGVEGAFAQALQGIQHLKNAGMEFQINTTVTKENLGSFKKIFQLAEELGAAAWHIFLLVPTGRAKEIKQQVIAAREYEDVLNWFYDFRKTTQMSLKATCAPHYYRILRQRAGEENLPVNRDNFGLEALTRGCLGGIGFCFVSQSGQVQPCGYLDIDCGQIREMPFAEIWRSSGYFLAFRDQKAYKGKCGVCKYHRVCGGCRARAFAYTGDPLESEPFCSYEPKIK